MKNETALSEEKIRAIRERLLRWYDEEQRALPWRVAPSEYKTVLSEVMLQQTQVAAAIPYFERFLALFPSFEALAAASEEEVLHAWSGLGYYQRARNLKRAAEVVVRQHGGRLPREAESLAALPGFGEYTVGAVGSIALGLPLPLVDGNVRRVVARLLRLDGDLTAGAGKKELWALCAGLVDPQRPGDFNQGLMELGAIVCQPREPMCMLCPLLEQCEGHRLGRPEAYPMPLKRPAAQAVDEVAVALMRQGQVLVVQRGEERSFAGMWELPRMDSRELTGSELTPARVLFELVRVRPGRTEEIGRAESTFTHHKIATRLYRAQPLGSQRVRRQRHVAHRWVRVEELGDLPASKAQRRLFALLADA